jgi:hypothetical protein
MPSLFRPAHLRPLGNPGFASLAKFNGPGDTIKLMISHARGTEGEQNLKVRQWAERIIKDIRPKDYLSEILSLRSWATSPWMHYVNDARHVEQVKTPFRVLTEIETTGAATVDCDDIATLLAALGMCIGREARYTMAGFGTPGEYTHVFCCLREPRSGKWIVCDPVAGTRELAMLKSASTYEHVSVDD